MKDYLWRNKGSLALDSSRTEETKWTVLGRKAGELLKDIVFHNSYGFLEVVFVEDKATVEMVREGKPKQIEVSIHEVELITPVQYRFD